MITAHVPSAEQWFGSDPDLITTSTNRNLLQPTKKNKERRQSHLQKDQHLDKGKHRDPKSRAPVLNGLLREDSTSSGSTKSGRSQLVDLVTEDRAAEETEQVRARKEGGARWNEDEQKHFVRNYEAPEEGLDIRHGFEPGQIAPPPAAASDSNFAIADEDEDGKGSDQEEAEENGSKKSLKYGDHLDDRNVWNES